MHSGMITRHRLGVLAITDAGWADFVVRRPSASAFHHPAWAALLGECYRFRSRAVTMLDDDGSILAGLPLVEIGPSGRRRWVSLPFTDRCGPLALDAATSTEFAALLADTRSELGVQRIEIRDRVPGGGWTTEQGHWHQLELGPDPEAIYARFHKSRVKGPIRRAFREGVLVERGQTAHELCDVFYGLHVMTRRRLGVPVQPHRFFELLWKRMLAPGLGFVLIARRDGVPIAGAVFLTAYGRVTYKYSASDRRFGTLGATQAVLWRAIEQSCLEGARDFDFGRTEPGNDGLRAFKLGWGAREEPLHHTSLAAGPPSARGDSKHTMLKALIRHTPAWTGRAIGALGYRYTA